MPRVNSSLIYLRPKKLKISKNTYKILSLLMMHKKKKMRNALADSSKMLGMEKCIASDIARSIKYKDSRPFQLSPEELLEASNEILKVINGRKST
jgi:16S rRNA A1518/A1519 N6-dimethyltransferase RsmA/KsgA/DIM1 with predicted DNA glycosylase/AP lyase activity